MIFVRVQLPAWVLAAVLLVSGAPAMAQSPPGGGGFGGGLGTPTGPVVGARSDREKPKEPAPPAVPGSRADSAPVVPSDKIATDLTPNDALFDAINRGDIAAVRDAINRGAELRGRNILGLSPTELSIDLGRNEITFLLLSMRGSTADDEASAAVAAAQSNARPGRATRTASAPAPSEAVPPARKSREARVAAVKLPELPAAIAPSAVAAASPGSVTATITARAPISPPAATPARQFAAGTDGSAIPQMGFLGFGGVAR